MNLNHIFADFWVQEQKLRRIKLKQPLLKWLLQYRFQRLEGIIVLADPKQGKAKPIHLFLTQWPRSFKIWIMSASSFLIKNQIGICRTEQQNKMCIFYGCWGCFCRGCGFVRECRARSEGPFCSAYIPIFRFIKRSTWSPLGLVFPQNSSPPTKEYVYMYVCVYTVSSRILISNWISLGNEKVDTR